MRQSEFGERGQRVDDAVWVVWAGADEEDGIWVDEATDVCDRDCIGWCWAGCEVQFNLEVFGGFLEGGVGGLWDDDFGFGDVALVVGFVAGGEDSHEDRLGAAGGGGACGVWGGVEEGEYHGYDFSFHLAYGWEDVGVDWVRDGEQGHGFML